MATFWNAKERAIHAKNKEVLEAAGYAIKQYTNSAYRLVLYAYHKNGKKVEISV